MKTAKSLLLILTVLCFTSQGFSQSNKINNYSKLPPKFIMGAVIGYNYVLGSANGEVTSFSMSNIENSSEMVFDPNNYGMQQGGGLTVYGKRSLNKKRNLYFTGELGYNLFYNTYYKGTHRTKWNILDLGAGMEFRNRSTPRNVVFFGMQLQYSLIFGGWQSNITFPDNSISNVYVKVKPASRLGLSISTGMEFRASKKSNIVIGLRGTWANMFPKSNSTTSYGYETSLNDSKNSNGIELSGRKEIIYMQLFTGLNFSIK